MYPSAPDAWETEAFPRLSPDQVERVIAFGVVQPLPRGTVLFEHGGELNIFNERAVLVGGRVGVDGRVARLNFPQFRRLLVAEHDVANVVMRAFMFRRERIIRQGDTAVTIIAPRRSPGAPQLLEAINTALLGHDQITDAW